MCPCLRLGRPLEQVFITCWRCRVSETLGFPLGLPASNLPTPGQKEVSGMQGWALVFYSKPFQSSLLPSASSPHFLARCSVPYPLALPASPALPLTTVCFHVAARKILCDHSGPSCPHPFPAPCTVLPLPGRSLPTLLLANPYCPSGLS